MAHEQHDDTDRGVDHGRWRAPREGAAADFEAEEAHWRAHFAGRPYVPPGASFDDYGPAFHFGVDAHGRYPERHIDELEADLSRDWEVVRGRSGLTWERAKPATRDAWLRVNGSAAG